MPISKISFVVVLVSSSLSLAAKPAKKVRPCEAVRAACHAAGYEPGKHGQKKGLMIDCMEPLMKGSSVPGVNVPAEELNACKERRGGGGREARTPKK